VFLGHREVALPRHYGFFLIGALMALYPAGSNRGDLRLQPLEGKNLSLVWAMFGIATNNLSLPGII
jgi:hypothetical protein